MLASLSSKQRICDEVCLEPATQSRKPRNQAYEGLCIYRRPNIHGYERDVGHQGNSVEDALRCADRHSQSRHMKILT